MSNLWPWDIMNFSINLQLSKQSRHPYCQIYHPLDLMPTMIKKEIVRDHISHLVTQKKMQL